MAFTSPPVAVTGTVVDEDYTNVFSDNDTWFNGLLPAPTAAFQIPISSSTSAASWGLANTAQIADGAVGTTALGTGPVIAGKIAPGAVTVPKLAPSAASALTSSGMVAWVRQVSEIPSGWTRESALDGRVPVGAGQTFGVTFVEATDYGASWSHNHTIADTSDTTGSVEPNLKNDTGGWPISNSGHTHALSGGTDLTAWAIPSRGVVYARMS